MHGDNAFDEKAEDREDRLVAVGLALSVLLVLGLWFAAVKYTQDDADPVGSESAPASESVDSTVGSESAPTEDDSAADADGSGGATTSTAASDGASSMSTSPATTTSTAPTGEDSGI